MARALVRDTAAVKKPGPHPAAIAATSDVARAGRSEADWLILRDPERARIASIALLEPGREADMNAAVGRLYAAYSRGDWELNTIFFDPDSYVFRAADLRQMLPDMRDEYHGVEGYLEAQSLFLEAFDDLKVEAAGVIFGGAGEMLSLLHWLARGRTSGVPIDQHGAIKHTMRDGLAIEQVYWWSRATALDSLGLQESMARG